MECASAYGSYLSTSDLQFGFKPGVSTDACTDRSLHCICIVRPKSLAASWMLVNLKAFDRVSHNTII